MQIKDSKSEYGLVTALFHWSMAVLMISLIGIGLYIGEVGFSEQTAKFYGWHKEFGIVVLGLVLLRIIWRANNATPDSPEASPKYQKLAAKLVHAALYLLMIAMPLSGWAMSSSFGYLVSFFGMFNMPSLIGVNKDLGEFFEELHEFLAFVLMFLIAVHVAAAFLHHFFYKDNVLKRMLLCKK